MQPLMVSALMPERRSFFRATPVASLTGHYSTSPHFLETDAQQRAALTTVRRSNMARPEEELIRRIHDSINRSMADRLRKGALIKSLQAENLRLGQELAALRSKIGSVADAGEGDRHVLFGHDGATVQVRR
jgi:hypothetical protein